LGRNNSGKTTRDCCDCADKYSQQSLS